MGRQTLNGIIDGQSLLFGFVRILNGFAIPLLLVEEYRDAVAQIYLIFGVPILYGLLQTLLIIKQGGIHIAYAAVTHSHGTAHGKHPLIIIDLLGKGNTTLPYGDTLSQHALVNVCHHLLTGKPTACGIGGIHAQSTVCQCKGHLFLAEGIVLHHFQQQSICLSLTLITVPTLF